MTEVRLILLCKINLTLAFKCSQNFHVESRHTETFSAYTCLSIVETHT